MDLHQDSPADETAARTAGTCGAGIAERGRPSAEPAAPLGEEPRKPPRETALGSWLRHHEVFKAGRFLTVGIVNGLLDLALFCILHYLAGWQVIPANVAAFTAALAFGFLLNKAWTFRDRSSGGEAVMKGFAYTMVGAVALVIATGTIWMTAKLLPAVLAKIAADLCAFAWSYAASRLMIFRHA